MRLRLLSPTKAEILDVAQHYESLRPGHADRVLFELLSKFGQIGQYPECYQLVDAPLRRVELVTVPYQLYYAVVEDVVPILGFVPAAMHPSRKHRLLNERFSAWQSA